MPDEACRDHVGGAARASDAAAELVGRIDCYRKFVGIDHARLNARITEAVEAHADYLEMNEVLSDPNADWWIEEFGEFGFTGRTSYDRLVKSEYLVEDFGANVFVWEVLSLVEEGLSYTERADAWLHNPFLRDVFLAPAWEGAGYAEFSAVDPYQGDDLTVSYMNVVLLHPSGSHATTPAVYPADGQIEVPLSWENPYVVEPQLAGMPAFGGYPITFTFGSTSPVGNQINPLGVEVISSVIVSPTEEVPHVVVLPDAYSFGEVWSTAMLVPLNPLQPNTTYTVTAELSWVERDNHVVTVTFTTSAGG